MTRKIYTQGCFDGACFLYSVANCYSALTGKPVSQASWDRAIANVPFLQNFMGNQGTEGIEENILMCILDNFLKDLPGKHTFKIKKESKATLSKAITKDSVAIFAIKGNTDNQKDLDHWACGVGMQNKSIMVACSWIGYDKNNYTEDKDPQTDRYYNDTITLNPAIVEDAIYSIKYSKNKD